MTNPKHALWLSFNLVGFGTVSPIIEYLKVLLPLSETVISQLLVGNFLSIFPCIMIVGQFALKLAHLELLLLILEAM